MISLVHLDGLSVEATARKAPNGDLIVVCTCGGTREPAPENQVYLFRSIDGGKTWSPKQLLNEPDGCAHYQTCTAVVGDTIAVFVSRHNGSFAGWKNYVLVSGDSGFTWTKRPNTLLPEYGFIRDLTVLDDGRLLFPYHYYPVTAEQDAQFLKSGRILCECPIPYVENGCFIGTPQTGFERRVAFVQRYEELPTFPVSKWRWTWTENTVVETEPGHLIMLYRVDLSDYLWRVDSYDGGRTWGKPARTDVPNPGNKPQLLKRRDGAVLLLNTPNNAPDFYLRRRFPLEIWTSYDGLRTWRDKVRVSDFPGAYSYPNGFIDDDGSVKLAFDYNRHDVYFASVKTGGDRI